MAGWGFGPFGLLLGWYGVSPCLTPTSPALMCLYHVERHGMCCPGISSFMRQRASYGDSLSLTTCLLKRKDIWLVTSILVPLFALFSLTSSCALKGSYSAYLRRRLSFGSGTAAPVAPRRYSRLQVSHFSPCLAANWRSVIRHPALTIAFQSEASVWRWLKFRCAPGTCCVV